jgi:hypothetical protein
LLTRRPEELSGSNRSRGPGGIPCATGPSCVPATAGPSGISVRCGAGSCPATFRKAIVESMRSVRPEPGDSGRPTTGGAPRTSIEGALNARGPRTRSGGPVAMKSAGARRARPEDHTQLRRGATIGRTKGGQGTFNVAQEHRAGPRDRTIIRQEERAGSSRVRRAAGRGLLSRPFRR